MKLKTYNRILDLSQTFLKKCIFWIFYQTLGFGIVLAFVFGYYMIHPDELLLKWWQMLLFSVPSTFFLVGIHTLKTWCHKNDLKARHFWTYFATEFDHDAWEIRRRHNHFPTERDGFESWCEEHFGGLHLVTRNKIYILKKQDAIYYKLNWG